MHLAVFIVKLLDPFSLLAALVLTLCLVRHWWQCILVGIAAALLGELILTMVQYTRTFGQAIVPALLAGTAHSAVALMLKRRYRQRRLVLAGVIAGALVLTAIPTGIGVVVGMREQQAVFKELTP